MLTANASGDAAVADLRRVGVDVAQVVDARLGEDVVRVRGRSGVRSVELADGRRIEADLLVTATGWTAPTALLNQSGDRPVYVPRAARFVPGSGLPDDVLATGGIAGDGSLDELRRHADAVGTEAARPAANPAVPAGPPYLARLLRPRPPRRRPQKSGVAARRAPRAVPRRTTARRLLR